MLNDRRNEVGGGNGTAVSGFIMLLFELIIAALLAVCVAIFLEDEHLANEFIRGVWVFPFVRRCVCVSGVSEAWYALLLAALFELEGTSMLVAGAARANLIELVENKDGTELHEGAGNNQGRNECFMIR